MEPHGHFSPPVLPSNAPALSPSYGSHSARALQERSSNNQRDVYESDMRKVSYGSSSENHYDGTSPGLAHESYAVQYEPSNGGRAEREFASLWRRLQRSDAYKKYRARQPRDAHERDQKWPEHMEVAFFRALVKYEPMGRRKQMLNGKLRGRNELIADEIEKVTREPRSRKQVSSHLQVLKTLMKHDSKIMRYMSKEDFQHRTPRSSYSHTSRRRQHTAQATALSDAPYHALSMPWQTDPQLATPYLPPTRPSTSTPLWTGTLAPAHFDMYVRDTHMRCIHTHTSFPSTSLSQGPDIPLSSLPPLSYYPPLAALLAQPLSTSTFTLPNVVLMHATFNIHSTALPSNAEICIREEFTASPPLDLFSHFEARTTFYLDGNATESVSAEIQEHDVKSGYLSGAPFGSMFWAYRFTQLAKKLRDAQDAGDEKRGRADVSAILDRMSAVQEVVAARDGWKGSQRVGLVCWQFGLAGRGEKGVTRWHRVDVERGLGYENSATEDVGQEYRVGEASSYAESFRSALTTPMPGEADMDQDEVIHVSADYGKTDLATINAGNAGNADYFDAHSVQTGIDMTALSRNPLAPMADVGDMPSTCQGHQEPAQQYIPSQHEHVQGSTSVSTSAPSLSRSASVDGLEQHDQQDDTELQPSILEFCIPPHAVSMDAYHTLPSNNQEHHAPGDGDVQQAQMMALQAMQQQSMGEKMTDHYGRWPGVYDEYAGMPGGEYESMYQGQANVKVEEEWDAAF